VSNLKFNQNLNWAALLCRFLASQQRIILHPDEQRTIAVEIGSPL